MIEHRIDPDRRLVIVTMTGRVGDDEAIGWFDALLASLRGTETVAGVIDTLALEALDLSTNGVRRITKLAEASDAVFTGSRWAVIAEADEVFGMARMYQILRSEAPYELAVFRDATAACVWLGVPELVLGCKPAHLG